MLIVVEGVDGSGKTTFVEAVSRRAGAQIVHRGPIKASPLHEYAYSAKKYNPKLNNAVFDRWHVGEMVYGPLYRGESKVDAHMARWIEMFLDSRGAVKVWMDTPYEVIKKRLDSRGEDFLQPRHLEEVRSFYEWYCTSFTGWIRVDPTWDDETIKHVIGHARMKADRIARQWELHPSYIGGEHIDTLFVVPVKEGNLAGAPYDGTAGFSILRAVDPSKRIGFVADNDRRILDLQQKTGARRIVRIGKDLKHPSVNFAFGALVKDMVKA